MAHSAEHKRLVPQVVHGYVVRKLHGSPQDIHKDESSGGGNARGSRGSLNGLGMPSSAGEAFALGLATEIGG